MGTCYDRPSFYYSSWYFWRKEYVSPYSLSVTMISLKLGLCYSAVAKFEPATSTSHSQLSSERRQQFSCRIPTFPCKSPYPFLKRKRCLLIFVATTFGGSLLPLHFLHAEELKEKLSAEGNNNEEGLVGGLLSLFDPNEKTKSGRVLPKSYVKSARGVVKNLRESLNEDVKDSAKFRRTADSAKEAIRDFMQNWTGQKSVASEDSYTALVSAIRVLANFYSKKGPTAALPEHIKSKVMDDLNLVEAAL